MTEIRGKKYLFCLRNVLVIKAVFLGRLHGSEITARSYHRNLCHQHALRASVISLWKFLASLTRCVIFFFFSFPFFLSFSAQARGAAGSHKRERRQHRPAGAVLIQEEENPGGGGSSEEGEG